MQPVETRPLDHIPCGYGQIAALTTVQNLPTIPPEATKAIVSVGTVAIRARFDAAPTASVGFPYAVGSTFEVYTQKQIQALQIVSQVGATEINVQYYKSA